MKRMYHLFPKNPEFERKYNFKANLPYIVRVMAGMNEKFGTFITDGPDRKATPVKAKRSFDIEITDKSVDFYPLNKHTLASVLKDVDSEGIIDFKVDLKYSFLDEKYDRVPFKGDTFLVRTELGNGILAMKVHHIEGMRRTDCERVADTIVDEITRNAP